NSYSDIFDYRIGRVIEWSIFLLFIFPLFKKVGNHIIIIILMILFFTPQTYFTSSYSDGANAIFITLVFFAVLNLLKGKSGLHELIGPLFLLSAYKSDSIYTIGVFIIAIIVVYFLTLMSRFTEKRESQLNIVRIFFVFTLAIVFNLYTNTLLPTAAQHYSSQYVNKIESDKVAQHYSSQYVNKIVQHVDEVIPVLGNNIIKRVSEKPFYISNLLAKIKDSLKKILPTFTNLPSFSIFIVIWLIYIYRHSSEEEKIATKFFLILYLGVFLYINLAYVVVFSKSELSIVSTPSFERYFNRVMLIPMVLVYKFYSSRHDLTKFINNRKIITLYLAVFFLTFYTQIWRLYAPVQRLVHQEIKGALQQCGIDNFNYDTNVHFIDQTATGNTRVIASMYTYPANMIGSPCIGERGDNYCYPNVKTYNDWLAYMSLYGTEYVVVYKINDYFSKKIWPKGVRIPSLPFCVRAKDWKILKSNNK
ncbi:hypothetical protein N9345_05525, partial [Candidatus Thioglobus sp.]|nr:hypothetical protein [Candidatus Thioglobus sp.]